MTVAYTLGLNQIATYWAPAGADGFGGVGAFGAPVQIACRWQPRVMLFRASTGEEAVSSAVVYVDRLLANKGQLQIGTVTGAPTPAAKEIRQVMSSPSLDATRELHKVIL